MGMPLPLRGVKLGSGLESVFPSASTCVINALHVNKSPYTRSSHNRVQQELAMRMPNRLVFSKCCRAGQLFSQKGRAKIADIEVVRGPSP